MSYQRDRGENLVSFRERIENVWSREVGRIENDYGLFLANVPTYAVRGQPVPTPGDEVLAMWRSLAEATDAGWIPEPDERPIGARRGVPVRRGVRNRILPTTLTTLDIMAADLDMLAEAHAIPPRHRQPLMTLLRTGPWDRKKGRKAKRRQVSGIVLEEYGRTAYGEYEFLKLMSGGETPTKTAKWLTIAYLEILPTLPPRVENRTYLQVGYQSDGIDSATGKPFKVKARSRTFPSDSTYESLYPRFDSREPDPYLEPAKYEQWAKYWLIEGVKMKSDPEDFSIRLRANPDWVKVHYLAPMPVGAAGKSAGKVTTLEDGTIVRDYECAAGTCLVAVANRLGGGEVPRPLKWCGAQYGFDRKNGLPMSALDDIEAITGRTLPVIDLATREVLRPPTPNIEVGIGAAIGYDAENKHFTHVIAFSPEKRICDVEQKLAEGAYTLTELIAMKKDMQNKWRSTWGYKGPGGGEEATFRLEISIISGIINKMMKRAEEKQDRRSLLICYDYETVYARDGKTKPYCISWCCLDMTADDPLADLPRTMAQFDQKVRAEMAGLVINEYCTDIFLQWMQDSGYVQGFNHIILEAFNGSRFDASFVAEMAHTRKKLLPKSLLVVGGGILKGSLAGGFRFHDISRFLCGSLEYNCKAFGIERAKVGGFSHADSQAAENAGEIDKWCKDNETVLREYSAFDVLALAELSWKAYQAFRKCPGEPDMFAHPTIASMAYKTLKSELKKRGQALPTAPQTIEDEQLMRGAMFAGRTQMMRGRGTVKGKLYMYDIASSYPYTMLNDHYPVGEYRRTDCEMIGKMGIYHCHIRSQLDGVNEGRPNVTVVPLRDPDGEKPLDWTHCGNLCANITSVDIEEIRATGNVVDVYEGVYWEESSVENFRPVLSGLEAIKGNQDRFKREKSSEYNGALREAAKLFMNSLSGKVAQRMKRKVTVLSSDYTTTAVTLRELEENSINLSVFGESLLITGTKEVPFNPKNASPCFLACFIYAYARRRLRAALLCGAWYCDTDSALFDEEGARRFREAHPDWLTPEGQDKKFGEWEEELGQDGTKDFECYMVQPKNYAIFGDKNSDKPCSSKCESPCCKPKIRSKGVGGRDVIISYHQAIKVMNMDEAARGEFCELNKNSTIKSPLTAKAVYKAGVESKPIYALCMQFHRECGAGPETNDGSLGGLFSLRQSYTIKQVGGTTTDKSEWDTLKKDCERPTVTNTAKSERQEEIQRSIARKLEEKKIIDAYDAKPERQEEIQRAKELREFRAKYM